jgi:DNA invertase Pin-like site-specific DNA recombinase
VQQAGCERLFAEQISSIAKRPELEAALAFVREGDTLVVTRLDRLARSTQDLLSTVERLDQKGVALRILDFAGSAIDSTKAVDKLLITVFAAFAEFERNLMLERQREGIAQAKAQGKYKGRAPTARSQADQIVSLAEAGLTKAAIAEALGISPRSVFRVLASRGDEPNRSRAHPISHPTNEADAGSSSSSRTMRDKAPASAQGQGTGPRHRRHRSRAEA